MTAGRSRGIVARIYGNLGALLGGKAAAGALSLIYTGIAARLLGPADYGMLVLIHGYTLVVAGVVTFPAWHAVVRYGAEALNAGDAPRLLRLMRFTALLELAAGVLAVALAALLAPIIGPHLGLDPTAQSFATMYCLAVLATVRTTPAGLLQLQGQFRLLGLHNIVNPLVRLAGTIVALAFHAGLRTFLATWLLAALAECLSMWLLGYWAMRRYRPWAEPPARAPSVRRENPGLFRFMTLANVDATFADLAPRIALLAVGWVLGPAAAGLYSIGQRATAIIAQPAIILGQAAYAELARFVAEGKRGLPLRHAVYRCVGIATLAASPVLFLLLAFPRLFIKLIAGGAFGGAAGIVAWLMLARVMRMAAPPAGAALVALGRPGASVSASLLAALATLPLLPLAMQLMGLSGAGMLAAVEAAIATGILVLYLNRETGVRRSAPG